MDFITFFRIKLVVPQQDHNNDIAVVVEKPDREECYIFNKTTTLADVLTKLGERKG